MDQRCEIAFVLAGLAVVGLACGRVDLDQPVGADDGRGGMSSTGGNGAAGAPGVGGAAGDVPCHQITDESGCLQRGAACRPDYCIGFVRCATPADSRLPCAPPAGVGCLPLNSPIIACPLSIPWCHPVYSAMPPPDVCPSPNVCAKLIACAENGTAQCKGATGTRCGGDQPSCAVGYTPAINNAGCYEGCVLLSYCGS